MSTPYQGYLAPDRRLLILQGMRAPAIAELLEEQGVIAEQELFVYYLRLNRMAHQVKAGAYNFSEPLTMQEVAKILVEGRIATLKMTFPEGWTASRCFRHLAAEGLGNYEEYMRLFEDRSLIPEYAEESQTLEGYLFPDTYSFPLDYDERQIVRTMRQRFDDLVWPEITAAAPKLSLQEIVTLASLVEKESGVREEQPLIASVFYNRLAKGMKLQCDPTVIYAEWLAKGRWDGKVNVSDLRRESPYNTYASPGLPPGPICNPGLSAVRAVLQPPRTRYLYFVSMNNGRHLFSADLETHNRAVQQYQRWQ
ncbi:MAG: endolytic transglycosylase MltG [Acidobacteria bacterium]|nr:endolytic transglycosylase MltG [Acidobacteriota bacterium]